MAPLKACSASQHFLLLEVRPGRELGYCLRHSRAQQAEHQDSIGWRRTKAGRKTCENKRSFHISENCIWSRELPTCAKIIRTGFCIQRKLVLALG